MIVVEGCDGTGKTSLAHQLSQDLGLRIGQRRTSNRDELYKVTREDTYTALAHAVEGYHPPFIWDRLGPFSDPIYARVSEREMAFKHEEMRHCMEVFKALRCPIIVCSIPLEVAQLNAEKDHQMGGVYENFEAIYHLYERLKDSAMLELNARSYDYRTVGAYDEIKDYIQRYLRRRKDREWH